MSSLANYADGVARSFANGVLFNAQSELAGLVSAGYGGFRSLLDDRVPLDRTFDVMRTMYDFGEKEA